MLDHRPKTIDHGKQKRLPSSIVHRLSSKMFFAFLLSSIVYGLWSELGFSAEKNWTGSGDGINWTDDSNWFPVMAPTTQDDVVVNALDAPVTLHEPFNAQSLSIGGNVTASVSVDSSISGTVAPLNSTNIAVLNGIKGKLILHGASGVMTLRGIYKDSETTLSDEPALVIYFE